MTERKTEGVDKARHSEQKVWKTKGLCLSKDRPHMSREQAEIERKMVEDFVASRANGYQIFKVKKMDLKYKGRVSGCQGL